MRTSEYLLMLLALAGGTSPLMMRPAVSVTRTVHVVDTVFIRTAPTQTQAPPVRIDYDAVVQRVLDRVGDSPLGTTVVDGDLIVKGRLGVGGSPEPDAGYAITVHGPASAEVLFIANEALLDPQRKDNEHRHVGTIGVAQDGGLRLGQNGACYSDSRGCIVDDKWRRRAYAGFDSMGDMSFYLANVDSLTGVSTAPDAQSLVFRLLDWDGNIHIASHRPGQRIYFNGSTTSRAADLQWEVPLR
jgi:hypothetical protein